MAYASTLRADSPALPLVATALAAVLALWPAVYVFRLRSHAIVKPHLQTFRDYINAYTTLRPAALGKNASSGFSHAVLPNSLNLPPRGLEPFQNHAFVIFSLFKDFSMIPQKSAGDEAVHFSEATNTVTAHCRMGGTVNADSEKGMALINGGIREWWTECVLMVKLSLDGKSIVEVREFVDSKKAEELQRRLNGVLSS